MKILNDYPVIESFLKQKWKNFCNRGGMEISSK